jgi:hypothetical protein
LDVPIDASALTRALPDKLCDRRAS